MTLATDGLANAKPYRWTYADATARAAASGFVSADVGALAWQQSDNTFWMLTATTPTWVSVAGGTNGSPAGLTGATAATRYVGGTASGAPASGTFAVGDFVIDQTGKLWVCTTAGTPGTWTQIGSGGGSFEAWHTVGSGGEPAFANSWVNYDSTNTTINIVQFRLENDIVRLRGLMTGGSPATAFTLPSGYRPPKNLYFATITNSGVGTLEIHSDGAVLPSTGGSTWFSVNCSFSTMA